jgi:Uma2 family endonuclease
MSAPPKDLTSEPASAGAGLSANAVPAKMPVIAIDMPVMYEDEGQEEMGDVEVHTITSDILYNGVRDHLKPRPPYRVFGNLNLYYHLVDHWAYISPDTMAIELPRPLPERIRSYRIGQDGPGPILAIEVLSRRSFQQQDLTNKPILYAQLGVAEYILVDVTEEFLPQRLLLKRLQDDGTWIDEQDPDGGVTSQLGFRIIIDTDGDVRVLDAVTGKGYVRPSEATAEAEARRQAEQRAEELAAELERLRQQLKDQGKA